MVLAAEAGVESMAASSAHGSATKSGPRSKTMQMAIALYAWAAMAFGTFYDVAYSAVGDYLAEFGAAPAGHPQAAATRAHNMVGTAITFGLALMISIVMMIITGLFIANAPTSGAFSGAINTAKDIGSAGYIIIAVVLLVIPVVGLISYFVNSGLGGFIGGAGMRRR